MFDTFINVSAILTADVLVGAILTIILAVTEECLGQTFAGAALDVTVWAV